MSEHDAWRLIADVLQKRRYNFPAGMFDGIDLNILAKTTLAIMKTESNLNPLAKNRTSTAAGLMQMLDGTRKWVESKLRSPLTSQAELMNNPMRAVRLGVWYIVWLYKTKAGKNWDRTIVAYNQGHYNTKPASIAYLQTVRRRYWATNYAGLSPNRLT